MFIVLIAALAFTANVLLDKYILSKRRVHLKNYIPVLFAFLFFFSLLTLPWLGGYNEILAANRTYIFYMVLMVLLAIIWNIFYYQGIQKEKMVEFQLIVTLAPLTTIFLATFFFPEEFSLPVFIAAAIGGLALLLSHLKKHHFEFDKYAIHLVLAVILMAMEVMVQRELLLVYSPATLYAIRTGIMVLFFTIYYRPQIHEIADYDFRFVVASAALGTLFSIARFTGFQQVGVTFTTLLLLITPVLVAWIDAKMYNSRVQRRTIIAFIVIVACVIYATIQGPF